MAISKIKLSSVRVNAGFTQAQLAEKMNVNRQTVTSWEKGYKRMNAESLFKLAEICNFPVENIELPKYRKKGESD